MRWWGLKGHLAAAAELTAGKIEEEERMVASERWMRFLRVDNAIGRRSGGFGGGGTELVAVEEGGW